MQNCCMSPILVLLTSDAEPFEHACLRLLVGDRDGYEK
jgi:hypothetical protein